MSVRQLQPPAQTQAQGQGQDDRERVPDRVLALIGGFLAAKNEEVWTALHCFEFA
jgi:hypothetical protein